MHIREATPEDADGIRTVAQESWDTDYPTILSRESIQEGVDEWYSSEQLRESLSWAGTLILVAESDDEIVGFAHAIWEREGKGDLLRVYVHPDYRGEGLGRRLFESVRDELVAFGADQLRAMVLEDNELGNAFYESFGFELTSTEQTTIGEETCWENTYVLDLEE